MCAAVLVLAGCTSSSSSPAPDPTPPATTPARPPAGVEDPATQPELSRFYNQEIAWAGCADDGVQCADLTVPLDWSQPAGETITVALTRSRASGTRVGSLVFNPGGPGVPARPTVEQYRQVIGPTLAQAFDFVGMDPRGVGASRPAVECLTDAEKDRYFPQDGSPDADTSVEDVVAENSAVAQGCERRTGALLAHVDSLSVARDLDVLRAVLDEEVLTYWGASYGTFIGAWYAQTFPWRVGRFVLDGAVDPSISVQEYGAGQVEGFDKALKAYVDACLAEGGCPLRGTQAEALDQLGALVEAADTQPLRTDSGRPLTQSLMVTGIIQALYADELWPQLTIALGQAVQGQGDALLQLADFYLDRADDGSYSNTFDANPAVFCLDHARPESVEQVTAEAEALARRYAPLGNESAWGGLGCLSWPVEPVLGPTRITADGAAPVVVVGTVGDPATPYRWAQSLADQLSSGVLVTFEGQGHTAFRRGNACVDDAVTAYLVAGTVPEDGLRCAVE